MYKDTTSLKPKSHQIYRDFQDKLAKVEDMAHTANNLKLNK